MKTPFVPSWIHLGTSLSEEMLREGWAVVYDQANAEYGDSTKEGLLEIQDEAKYAHGSRASTR